MKTRHEDLLHAISSKLEELEEAEALVICDTNARKLSQALVEAIDSLIPRSDLSPSELHGVRALILETVKQPNFFDWEMPSLTGFSAKEFEEIANKLPRE